MNKSVRNSASAAKALYENVEELRMKIVTKNDQILILERTSVSLSVATDRVDHWLESLHNEDMMKSFMQRFMYPTYKAPMPAEALDFMMGALSQIARGEMIKILASNYSDTLQGLSDADRASKIKEAKAELLALELAEEAIVRDAEQYGLDILRRAEADPRAVLAAQEDLR